MTSETFHTREHLKTRSDFSRVYSARCSVADDALIVYARPNRLAYSRVGLSVAKRVGRAVDRAYVRRRLREAFRRNKKSLAQGYDFVCVARAGAKHHDTDIVKSLIGLTNQAVSRWARRKKRADKPIPSPDRSTRSSDRRHQD